MKNKQFPRGFNSWMETHYDIVYAMTIMINDEDIDDCCILYKRYEEEGQDGLYMLSQEITDEFEKEYKGAIWGADFNYYETLENYLNTRL